MEAVSLPACIVFLSSAKMCFLSLGQSSVPLTLTFLCLAWPRAGHERRGRAWGHAEPPAAHTAGPAPLSAPS